MFRKRALKKVAGMSESGLQKLAFLLLISLMVYVAFAGGL